jgi:hypothetical protein
LAYRCDISSKKIFIEKKLKIIDAWLYRKIWKNESCREISCTNFGYVNR